MAKTFLRSGNPDALLSLGENGKPVFLSALQIRETLRLRNYSALADCLAIPQACDRGDRLYWYAPFEGKVKSWLAASPEERQQALTLLTEYQQTFREIAAKASATTSPAQQLFAALLSKSLHFPGQQYISLVNGKPVITFWGFVENHEQQNLDPLACLRDTLEERLPLLVAEKDVQETEVITPEPVSVVETPPAKPQSHTPRWVLPVSLAAACALGLSLLGWQLAHPPQPAVNPEVNKPVAAVKTQPQPAPIKLPLMPASIVESAPPPPPPVPVEPAKADDLVLNAEAVRAGTVQFLNGRWLVTLQPATPASWLPEFRYQFRNGRGSVTMVQSTGVRCSAEASGALMGSGELEIRSRFTARCSDGSRYRMPQLFCKQGEGAARCQAQLRDDQTFPMMIKRESR
ncbi:SrfA family protein [Candidatus Pantoea multigeneris]|uniref:Virulence factor n=1 Tax=Candidatus Pantoea multigeneris TaxID=2608357 RepID=A0ABX0RFY9_9GAMM|nr:hypothetical protein [Pantoea multigeneris]